jgi:hypothetical protein
VCPPPFLWDERRKMRRREGLEEWNMKVEKVYCGNKK